MNIPGDVVAYDARSGQVLWRFNTVPKEGEFRVETWQKADEALWNVPTGTHDWVRELPELLDASWKYTGNIGHWAPVTVDEELGLFYVPTETATNDYFGGYRPGENLFANSVVALDAETGERVWHFQLGRVRPTEYLRACVTPWVSNLYADEISTELGETSLASRLPDAVGREGPTNLEQGATEQLATFEGAVQPPVRPQLGVETTR